MSDIQAGDLVVGVPASRCAYGAVHDAIDEPGTAGATFRVAAIRPNNTGLLPQIPFILSTVGRSAWFCAGCFRKLNDGEDDAELIERIKNCRPAKAPARFGFQKQPSNV